MKITFVLALTLILAVIPGQSAERFVSTSGTVHREIPADRAMVTLEVKAPGDSIEQSNSRLVRLMDELRENVAALGYPTTAVTLRIRSTERAREWSEGMKIWRRSGFESSAIFSINFAGLEKYGDFLTYLGTRDGHQILWQSMASSAEGAVRREAIAEALRAARAKAEILATEGGTTIGRLVDVTEEEVETREFRGGNLSANSRDPSEGTGAHPIGIFVRVRARFELKME